MSKNKYASTSPEITNSPQEIDLGMVFKSLIRKFFAFVFVIKQRWLILTLFILGGIGVQAVSFFVQGPIYQTTAVIKPQALSVDHYKDQLSLLQETFNNGARYDWMRKQGLSREDLKEVFALSFREWKESTDPEEVKKAEKKAKEPELFTPLHITIKVKDPELAQPLGNSLLEYLKSSSYMQRIKEREKEKMQKVLERLESDQDNLEKLKVRLTEGTQVDRNVGMLVFNQPLEITDAFSFGMELYERQLTLEERLNDIEEQPFFVIKEFSTPSRPVNELLSVTSFLKYTLLFGFLGIVVIMLIEITPTGLRSLKQ